MVKISIYARPCVNNMTCAVSFYAKFSLSLTLLNGEQQRKYPGGSKGLHKSNLNFYC